MHPIEKLDIKIVALERKLSSLKKLRAFVISEGLSETLGELVNDSLQEESNSGSDRFQGMMLRRTAEDGSPSEPSRSSLFDHISTLFIRRGNEALPVAMIAKLLSMPQTAVRQVIYRTAKDRFEKIAEPGKNMCFRLKGIRGGVPISAAARIVPIDSDGDDESKEEDSM